MLKFLTQIGGTETVEVTQPEDIFNPSVNTYLKTRSTVADRYGNHGLMSVAEFMSFLEVLYSEENIRAHPEFLVSSFTPAGLALVLEHMEPSQYKYLPFIGCEPAFFGDDLRGSYIHMPKPSVTSDYWARFYLQEPTDIDQSFQVTAFKKNLKLMDKVFAAIADTSMGILTSSLDGYNPSLWLLYMMSYQQYMRRHSGNSLTLSEVLTIIFPYNIRYTPGVAPLLIELSTDGKSHLYKHFNYNVDVRDHIPGPVLTEIEGKSGKKYRRYPGEPTYGIELELSCTHTVNEIINSQELPYFICKRDGSISGEHPNFYECVTVPMDRRSQRIAWGKFFAKFWDKDTNSYKGFDNSTDTTNGMHIHVSRSSFKDKHLKRFTWFFVDPLNTEFITAVSERGTSLGEYARIPSFGRLSRKQAYDCCLEECSEMRGAVNLRGTRSPTIEVRIFKGIVSYATLLKNLEFVDAVYYYTLSSGYSKLTVADFTKWVEGQSKTKYKALKLFLDGLDKTIAQRSLIGAYFAQCQAEDVFEIVAKRGLVVDDGLLGLLNTQFPNRSRRSPKFAIHEGKLVFNVTAQGALRRFEGVLNPFTGIAA